MLVCYTIFMDPRTFGINTYRLYDKDTKRFDDINEYALVKFLESGKEISNIKLDERGNIVGKDIDIKRLRNYSGENKFTIISELTDDKGDVVGYEAITSDARIVQINKKDITSAARFGRVTNMTYVDGKEYARLITKNGVDTKVKTVDYLNMDTSWDTSMSTAKNIFKAYGFELGYSERYTYTQNYCGEIETKDMILNIMYDKNGNILYFEEDASGKDNKLCYHGGHLVTETAGRNISHLDGSSAFTKSKYANIEFTYNTFDIRDKFVRNYKNVIENQKPLPYMLDDNGRKVYELDIATRKMIAEREKLTEELAKDDNLFGFGLEYLVFIRSRYNKFNDRLKQILMLYYEHNTDLIINLAISDITGFNFNKIDKHKFKNMVSMLNSFCSRYGIKEDWQKLLQEGILREKASREERERANKEEREKRVVNTQNSGVITGLFGMFSKK